MIEGAYAVAVMDPLDSDQPAVKVFLATQKKYMPGKQPTTYSMHGYNAGKIFIETLKRTKGRTAPNDIVAALEGMTNFDTGLMAPISFSKNEHAGSRAGAIMKAEKGRWNVITGWLKA